jgi:hypothetical protein
MPDGTIIWTSPTGHTYTTYPGSKHLFRNCANPRRPCGPAIHQLSSPLATAA